MVVGVAGHLSRAERTRLWGRLADRLAPGGVIVVELMGVATPRRIPPTRLLRDSIGTQVYEWWTTAEARGADLMRFQTTWKVLRDGVLLRQVHSSYDWHTFSLSALEDEAGMAGKLMTPPADDAGPAIAVLVR